MIQVDVWVAFFPLEDRVLLILHPRNGASAHLTYIDTLTPVLN